jgi:Bifunctional DNA primase/polymerase, N-terminal
MPNPPAIYPFARRLVAAGLSVIPIAVDGTKRPAGWLLPKAWDEHEQRWTPTWKPYQRTRPTDAELARWFGHGTLGVALIGGAISGHLEILDFDAPDIFMPWCGMVDELAPGLVVRLPLGLTPSDGRHLYYRCPIIEGNLKLAQRSNAEGRPETLIETRGEGGYAIIPPSPPQCHPLGRPYRLLQGDLAGIPMRTTQGERTILLNAARSFNAYVKPEHMISGSSSHSSAQVKGERPGDLFNAQTDWPAILDPHGWTRVGQRGEVILWRRPGKRDRGCSATTNFAGSDLLYVFSSNAWPFEPEAAYSKFAAYALLEHRGDFSEAAKAVMRAGYGARPPVSATSEGRAGTVGQWGGIRIIPTAEVSLWPC